jgi:phage tail-like protein
MYIIIQICVKTFSVKRVFSPWFFGKYFVIFQQLQTMPDYPLPKFHFLVEWGGVKLNFSEVSGLDVSTDAIEYREGSSPEFHKIKMPGMRKLPNITLKRGVIKGGNNLSDWWETAALNTKEKKDLTISLLNEKQETVSVWKIKQAWPVKVQATDLKAGSNNVAIETIELAHEGITALTGNNS